MNTAMTYLASLALLARISAETIVFALANLT
jgi:hypothetical protein